MECRYCEENQFKGALPEPLFLGRVMEVAG